MSDEEDFNLDKEILIAEIENRLEDLRYEYEDDELSEVKINEKIRDEFKDPKYNDALIELGINLKDTGLKKIESDDSSSNLLSKNSNKDNDKLISVLLDTTDHVRRIDKRIRGFEEIEKDKWQRKILIFIPAIERIKITSFLDGIWSTQNIISNKRLSLGLYEGRMNKQLQDIRVRLENYPDHIIKPGTIKYVIGILLNEVAVVINSIESGNLGKIATDMVTGSYNERSEPQKELNKDDVLKALTK